MGIGVGEHGVPFLCKLGGVGVYMVRHTVFCNDIRIVKDAVDDLSVHIHILKQL